MLHFEISKLDNRKLILKSLCLINFSLKNIFADHNLVYFQFKHCFRLDESNNVNGNYTPLTGTNYFNVTFKN